MINSLSCLYIGKQLYSWYLCFLQCNFCFLFSDLACTDSRRKALLRVRHPRREADIVSSITKAASSLLAATILRYSSVHPACLTIWLWCKLLMLAGLNSNCTYPSVVWAGPVFLYARHPFRFNSPLLPSPYSPPQPPPFIFSFLYPFTHSKWHQQMSPYPPERRRIFIFSLTERRPRVKFSPVGFNAELVFS
jgi:hypothetical protein